MTREKQYQVEVVKKFVDTVHQYQRATNNSLFWGSPSYGINRATIPEFDLTMDRAYSVGWANAAKSIPDTYEIEICTPDVLVSVRVTTPPSSWITWHDLTTLSKAKWTVETVGDVSCLNDVSTWLKLNWPIDSE